MQHYETFLCNSPWLVPYRKDGTAMFSLTLLSAHDQKHLELKMPRIYPEKLFWTSQYTIFLFAFAHSLQRFTTWYLAEIYLVLIFSSSCKLISVSISVSFAFGTEVPYFSYLCKVLMILLETEIPSLSSAFSLACTLLSSSSFARMVVHASKAFIMTLNVLFSHRRSQQAVSLCWPFQNFSVPSS